ncbi:MAG TPA: hypothetical protein VK808_12010 [Bacteroidia bacterium]|jgi:hypothetical protein|nr:hypothetical protein [Bacteroidia bacterium]
MLSWKDYRSNVFPDNAEKFIALTKDIPEKEYLTAFLGVLHSIMCNYGTDEILAMGYAPMLKSFSELCGKYDLEKLSLWLNGIRIGYEHIKTEFDDCMAKNDRERIRGLWNWFKEYDEEYFKIVPK